MAVDAHLPECPLCRQRLSEFEAMSFAFKAVPRLSAPENLVETIRASVATELAQSVSSPTFVLIDRRRSWKEIWLIPSFVGSAASLLIGFALISFMVTPPPVSLSERDSIAPANDRPIMLATNYDLTPDEYANSRLSIAAESPSVNPRGALVALTKSLVRGEMRDDEVTVVADVFGNGLAQIAQVVEPSHDQKAVEELERALQSDPSFAPFVPANVDQRSDTIRVVFKIQNVNVKTSER